MDILSAVDRYKMFERGDSVLVAVSGGPDSVALLFALHSRREQFGISIHIAHMNHGIRGQASDEDELFVRQLADRLQLPITVEGVDIPSLRKKMKMGEEEAAREIRHDFLRRAAAQTNSNKIALGHNADDRAESVLLNILRGTGIDGLGSIRPVRGNIIRPLINTFRSEIETYIEENSLSYRLDESNLDTTYTRNRVRCELIPHLEHSYNPQIKCALLRLADIASMQSDLLEQLVPEKENEIRLDDGLNSDEFLRLPQALQHQILRAQIAEHKGDLRDVTFEQTQRVIDAVKTGANFTITLPSGKIFAVRRERLLSVRAADEEIPQVIFDHLLIVPGRTMIPETGVNIVTEIEDNPRPTRLPANETLIDTSAISGVLHLRSAEPGDRIVPFGMRGSKKLQDVFVDKKIPRAQRASAAVVADDEKILWVVGIVSSELARVSANTSRAYHLVSERG